jgi:hypothetical protein
MRFNMPDKKAKIVSVNRSILEELNIEELEEKIELSPIAAIDALITRVELFDPSALSDCGCNLQCGSFCNGNSGLESEWLSRVIWPVEKLADTEKLQVIVGR